MISLERLIRACGDESLSDGIRIDAELVPLGGPGAPVKPPVYEGGQYQLDKRWASPDDDAATDVVVIDNVPSQANRLEEALRLTRERTGIPEFVLNVSGAGNLPSHVLREVSSLAFPHRNADAYLRDSRLEGVDFLKTDIGRAIFAATAGKSGPLAAWFPQALLFGFWQSHLGKKRHSSKHARAWVSEIVGWQPATTDTVNLGLKGDPLNLNTADKMSFDENDQATWVFGSGSKVAGGKTKKLSEIGHGQVPFMREGDASPAAVSCTRITQRATLSFAQLRRIRLGSSGDDGNAVLRALLCALGLYAHQAAFSRGFALRSGAELRPVKTIVTWLDDRDEVLQIGSVADALSLLESAKKAAQSAGVPLDGWDQAPMVLAPKQNLLQAIRSTWPELSD